MAKKKDEVTVLIKFDSLKEAVCSWCGTTFHFCHQQSVAGAGANEFRARQDALEKACSEVEEEIGHERCPGCGALQTCMMADTQATGHGCLIWVGEILFVIAVGLGLLLSDNIISFVSMPVLSWFVGGASLLLFTANVYLARMNPNADLSQGLEIARKSLNEKQLAIVTRGSTSDVPESIPCPMSLMQIVLLVLMGFGTLSVAGAEMFRLTAGWPANRSARPLVAGPGDEVMLFFPETLPCLKGNWRGTVQVDFTDADGKWPKRPLPATCRTEDWGRLLLGKRVKNQDTLIWTKIQIPDDAEFSDKSLRLHSEIAVTYPTSTGLFGFEDREAHFTHDFELHLATARAGQQYEALWWIGLLGGGGLIVLSNYLLRHFQTRLAKNSPQPRTLSVKEAVASPGDDDDDVPVLQEDE